MQVVRQVGTGVCRDISLALDAQEVHVLKSAYYLVGREVPASAVDPFCEILVEYQCQEATYSTLAASSSVLGAFL